MVKLSKDGKMMKIKNSLTKTINAYDREISDYLMSPNFIITDKDKPSSIIDSVFNIIDRALKDAPDNMDFQKNSNNPLYKCDYVYFGDVHGQLDLLLQNLYVAKVIKKDGSLSDSLDKKVVQLGDTIDEGAFQWETLVYLRMLKNEAHNKGIDFIYLVGNKEISYVINPRASESDNLMGKMLKQDIESEIVQLSFTPADKNIISFHSSMEKEILLDSLLLMCESPDYITKMTPVKKELKNIRNLLKIKHSQKSYFDISLKSLETIREKTSSERIYQVLNKNNISLNDLSNWLNKKFIEVIKEGSLTKESPYHKIFVSSVSLTHSKLKATKKRHHELIYDNTIRKYLIDPLDIKYQTKPLQISGHKQTVFGVKEGIGNKGGIMQNRANIFADCGLTSFYGGYQAFVGFNSKSGILYAIELLDNGKAISGLSEDKNPISLAQKATKFKIRTLESLKAYDKPKTISW